MGTYDYQTRKPVDLTDGYMVSFHQNEPDEEGHYKSHYGRYTDDEYDKLVQELVSEYQASVYIGVYDEEPEISFLIHSIDKAVEIMEKFNQKSIWDNKNGREIINLSYDKKENPMRGD